MIDYDPRQLVTVVDIMTLVNGLQLLTMALVNKLL